MFTSKLRDVGVTLVNSTARVRIIWLVSLLLIGWRSLVPVLAADAFDPLQSNIFERRYERHFVDIQLPLPKGNLGAPLRLRLEMSYLNVFLREPDHAVVTFAFHRSTGLPQNLIDVVSVAGRFHRDIPGIPSNTPEERRREAVSISMDSVFGADSKSLFSKELALCQRTSDEFDLEELSGASIWCRSPMRSGKFWLAVDDDGSLSEPVEVMSSLRQWKLMAGELEMVAAHTARIARPAGFRNRLCPFAFTILYGRAGRKRFNI